MNNPNFDPNTGRDMRGEDPSSIGPLLWIVGTVGILALLGWAIISNRDNPDQRQSRSETDKKTEESAH